jgi:hypothetical protein
MRSSAALHKVYGFKGEYFNKEIRRFHIAGLLSLGDGTKNGLSAPNKERLNRTRQITSITLACLTWLTPWVRHQRRAVGAKRR